MVVVPQPLPQVAAWRHLHAREGFEVVFSQAGDGYRFEGVTGAVEAGEPWWVHYVISLAADWATTSAVISGRSRAGVRKLTLEAVGTGRWKSEGSPVPDLDGCPDVDLESSALTNAFPANRLGLEVGEAADAPAAYVRVADLRVERLEQRYVRLQDEGGRPRYRYVAPSFDVECELAYDESGLLLDYPGLAERVV